jgi:PAS domain S-box-containing protein
VGTTEYGMDELREIANSTPVIVIACDVSGHYTCVNQAFLDFVELPESAVLGRSAADLFPAELATVIEQENQRVLATREPPAGMRHSALKRLSHRYTRFPLFDRDGNVSGTALIATDTTEDEEARRFSSIQRDLGIALSEIDSLNDGLRLCLRAALDATLCDAGGIYLVDAETGALHMAMHEGPSEAFR